MRTRIRKAYSTNPILMVHIAAALIWGIGGALSAVIQLAAGFESIPQWIMDANVQGFVAAIFWWLGAVSARRCKAHQADESKITYFALKLYSIVMRINAVALGLRLVVSLLTPLIGLASI